MVNEIDLTESRGIKLLEGTFYSGSIVKKESVKYYFDKPVKENAIQYNLTLLTKELKI